MKKINEEQKFKPTLDKPMSVQSKNFDSNFKKTMNKVAPDVKLNEVDGMLSEAEQSLKKKIFSLAKMEALVFSDPKLSAVYEEMAENGEEKYGYHYNETIQNMIFNDYVLNSPKYLQKYKMAIPKEKKRRDKSGINQLKKAGVTKMSQSGLPKNPKSENESTGAASAGAFVPALDNKVDETTTSASSGAYVGPAAWSSKGDLMGDKGKPIRKPMWPGGKIIQETQYLTDPTGFEEYINKLNEQIDIENPSMAQKPNTSPYTNKEVNDKIINDTSAFTSDAVKNWNKPDTELELNTINSKKFDGSKEGVDEIAKSKAQQRLFGMAHAVQKGELPASKVGSAVKKIAKDVSPKDVEDFASTKHDDLPEKLNENLDAKYQADNIYKYAVKSKYIIGLQGREDILYFKTEIDALNYVNDKPKMREYLGIINPNNQSEKLNEMKIKEETSQSMIAKPSVGSMANYAAPAGDQGGNVPMGTQQTGGMNESDEFIPHGSYTVSNTGGYEIMLNNSGDAARVRDAFGSDNPQTSDWLEIEYVPNEEGESEPVIDPNGYNIPLSQVMRLQEQKELNLNTKLLEELNKELEAYSIHQQKLMKMTEDRKPSALVLKDRVGAENQTNFKKDMSQSDTKQIIDVQKELEWKDQQTEIGKDPQKLGQDIEKDVLKTTDGEAFKNAGDSTNEKGNEIPKRNLTSDEQEEVNMYRLGQHSLNYDNEPSKRFEERMKKDMGDDIYKMRQKQMEFRSKAPMYNKDTQPTETGVDKSQFNKEESGWNQREGLNESMITGRYIDALGKRKIIDFTLNEVKLTEASEDFFELDFTGLGNAYLNKSVDNKVVVNESVVNIMNTHKFYTDGKSIIAIKNQVQNLTENEQKNHKVVVNEQIDKMKHLLGYKPKEFVNTTNVKRNRGF